MALPYFDNATFSQLSIDFSTGLIFGSNNELFLLDGSNQAARYATGVFAISSYTKAVIEKNIHSRTNYCKQRSIKYAIYSYPNKETALVGNYCSNVDEIVSLGKSVSSLGVKFIDVPSTFAGNRTYYINDTHMTTWGNIFSVLRLFEDVGVSSSEAEIVDHFGPFTEKSFKGDLGIRLSPPQGETIQDLSKLYRHLRYDNGISNTGNLKVFHNFSANRGTIVIFGDSFSWRVAPFFSQHYRSVVFLHSPHFHAELVESFTDVEVVLNLNVERFYCRALPDEARPIAFRFGAYYGKESPEAQNNEAVQHWAMFPYSPHHAANYSKMLARTRKVAEATKVFEDFPADDADSLFWKGRLKTFAKDWIGAIEQFTSAIEANPAEASFYFHISKAFQSDGQLECAGEAAVKALCLRPASDDMRNLAAEYIDPNVIYDLRR